jgi:hypothetical protein
MAALAHGGNVPKCSGNPASDSICCHLFGMMGLFFLAGPASARMIQGRPFRYPIIGKILEKRMQLSQSQ